LAGAFSDLRAVGTVARAGLRVTIAHRFRNSSIEERWDFACRKGCVPGTVDVELPTWGADTRVVAELAGGGRVELQPGSSLPLAGVVRLDLGGYDAVPLLADPGATLRLLATSPQATDTRPGPTLAITIAGGGAPLHAARLALRLEPVGEGGG
jgi:hypothetical protein